jgi:hypothetical protein
MNVARIIVSDYLTASFKSVIISAEIISVRFDNMGLYKIVTELNLSKQNGYNMHHLL